jgi:hypothetical protein
LNTKINPKLGAVIVVIVLILIFTVGYKKYLAPPRQVHGIMNGHEMTDEEVTKMADAMSHGQYSIQQKRVKELQAKAAAAERAKNK